MSIPLPFRLGADLSPDDPKDADHAFEDSEVLAGTVLPNSDTVSILDAHEWRTQRFNDCVGMSIVVVTKDNANVLGIECPTLAPLMPYNMACFYGRPPGPGERMADVGTSPRLGVKAAMHCGLVAESEFPEVEENVGLVPPMDLWQSASVARVKSYHRITSENLFSFRRLLIDALKLAREGKAGAPMFSMPVFDNYFVNKGEVYTATGGTRRGYHMQPIAAYDPPRDAFLIPASWQRDLIGDNGVIPISTECLYAIGKEFWCAVIDFTSFKVKS